MRRLRLLVLFGVFAFPPCPVWPQGVPLGPEFRVNTYTPSQQFLNAVATDPAGNFVVVWESEYQDGSYWGLFGQRYTSSGAPIGPEFRVNTYTTDGQRGPSVASDASGNFVVVWESATQDGSYRGIFGQRYSSSGAPAGPEFRVNSYTTGFQISASVAWLGSGQFVVVWQSLGQDSGGVFGQRFAASGAPVGPEFRVNTYSPGSQLAPAVASDGSGNFVVVWVSSAQDGSDYGIFGQRYAGSGAPLGPEFRVNSYTSGRQAGPAVASDASGNFVIVWNSDAQDSGGVLGQRYAASGVPVGPEFRVNTYTTSAQGVPSVASDSAGNFVTVWQSYQQDGFSQGIFGQRFASSGAPVGSEFRVNTFTTYGQFYPSVRSDTSGNFVVVWISYSKGPNDSGVYGQRYSQIVPVELMRFGVE